MENTNIERRGVRNASFSNDVKEKISIKNRACAKEAKRVREHTNMIRYGVDNYAKTKECHKKMEETSLELYGVKHYSETDECKKKVRSTNQEKFGRDYYSQTNECKERVANTSLQKFGETNIFKTNKFKQDTINKNLEKYNKKYYTQTDEYKIKSKETWSKKTLEELNSIKEKAKQTRIKNGNQYPDNFVGKFLSSWKEDRKPSPRDLLNFVHENYNENADLTNIYTYINKDYFKLKQSLLENIVEKFLTNYNIKYEKV